VREVAEETGLECVCGELLGWVEIIGDGEGQEVEHHFVVLDFVATVLEHGEPVAGDDAAEVRWVPVGDVLELNLVDGLAEFLHEHGILDAFT
jgi:ADP-ribose pyrophosphatase YjhB (NUDIX family)